MTDTQWGSLLEYVSDQLATEARFEIFKSTLISKFELSADCLTEINQRLVQCHTLPFTFEETYNDSIDGLKGHGQNAYATILFKTP